ncbi:MAG: hypothetical protein A2729_02690 [Candidatus Buchananbacteria bacterium RIFCSPHIGHO2_01_FULL_39_14]|uniref:Uncharacterized protein n=1 Tax=Candidatus Buchananbacteria bacterium RIFCSPHIGHO2_01_FULL_39_14 TaxID=1797532 RepID=A0A1G1XSE5_9BACT|nr:MAG: hypothetical protein A2729_02690 [Candidatus Buchananbacteria bacterium RIFCSPHIGHO2_01_FULL_39_14]
MAKNSNFLSFKIKFEPRFFRNDFILTRSLSKATFLADLLCKMKSPKGSSQLLPWALISLIFSSKSNF